jgi:MoaA/NifB/PqqE/SkfB family radical SAM enzyme
MELKINTLILEITRRCNLSCGHCLRGNQQNMDMFYEIIDKTLQDIDSIWFMDFTGGEPLLHTKAIHYTFDKLHELEIPFDNFWLATNGYLYKRALIKRLNKEYEYCKDLTCNEFYGGIAISLDEFHGFEKDEIYWKFANLPYYRTDKESKKGERREWINIGNAKKHGYGRRNLDVDKDLHYELEEDKLTIEQIYINAKGDVLQECDLSYDLQEEYKLGNVLEKSLIEIIMNNILEQDPEFSFQDSNLVECEVEA